MPPVIKGKYYWNKGEWEDWRIIMFFLKTTYYDSANQTSNPNIKTKTSNHTIPQDWHDMKRAAENFIRVLDRVQLEKKLVNGKLRIDREAGQAIYEISSIGADRASGVRLDFVISIFNGCEIEDYNEEDICAITIPEDDSHPEHSL